MHLIYLMDIGLYDLYICYSLEQVRSIFPPVLTRPNSSMFPYEQVETDDNQDILFLSYTKAMNFFREKMDVINAFCISSWRFCFICGFIYDVDEMEWNLWQYEHLWEIRWFRSCPIKRRWEWPYIEESIVNLFIIMSNNYIFLFYFD